jgi:N-acetylglucosaminyldiphosphoundecaprenol N-acetyl-beta-D-mannosaminyltransferase
MIIEDWIKRPADRCRQVIATGFHGLWVAYEDEGYRSLLNSADMFCPDGIAPIWLSRLLGSPLPQRTPGPELFEAFLHSAQTNGFSSYFYGETEDTLTVLCQRLSEKFPGVTIAGAFSPPFRKLSDEEEASHIEAINQSGADVLWVALGAPKQDQWIARNLPRLKTKVAVGVGAAFAFQAGKVSRAPKWLGNAGFEWVWRFAHEPKKMWKRVFHDGPRFIIVALIDLAKAR